MTDKPRCEYAIHFGITLHTRCMLPADHVKRKATVKHIGGGLSHFPGQTLEWLPGDRREYVTDRTDKFTWEEPSH
jgi:hypothetical protein